MANSREARALNRELREIHKGGILEKIYERQENAKKEAEGGDAAANGTPGAAAGKTEGKVTAAVATSEPAKVTEEVKAVEKKKPEPVLSDDDKTGATSAGPTSQSAPPRTAAANRFSKVVSPNQSAEAGPNDLTVCSQ